LFKAKEAFIQETTANNSNRKPSCTFRRTCGSCIRRR